MKHASASASGSSTKSTNVLVRDSGRKTNNVGYAKAQTATNAGRMAGRGEDKSMYARLFGITATVLGSAQSAWAATALPGLNSAVDNFTDIFLLMAFGLAIAAVTTIVYSVARNRYGMPWDEALSSISAAALAGGAFVIIGWVGLAAAAPLPPLSAQVVVVAPAAVSAGVATLPHIVEEE